MLKYIEYDFKGIKRAARISFRAAVNPNADGLNSVDTNNICLFLKFIIGNIW